MAKAKEDTYANVATITVIESAANTLTFKKLETGISLQEKVAWLISRIEYYLSNTFASLFGAASDIAHMGLSVTNLATTYASYASFTDPALLDKQTVELANFAAAGTGIFITKPMIKDLSTLPGGGILVPPAPLYGWAQGEGIGAAISLVIKLYYTQIPLTVDDYWQLVEARRFLSS